MAGKALGAAIDDLLERLPGDSAVWVQLAANHELDVFCGLFLGTDNQGLDLSSRTLSALADRGLTLGLDIYSHFGE